jgi:hypothetical protein
VLYKKPKSNVEPLEFVGVQPRNKHIDDVIRKVGYMSVTFNNNDFFDAVIWATNLTDKYEKHYAELGNRVVIPLEELGDFKKSELIDAYHLLLLYYHKKSNFNVLELLKSHLMTVAKFQNIAKEHVKVMRNWDDYMADVKSKMERDDYSAPDIGDLGGTEEVFEHYKDMIEREQLAFKDKMRKEIGLRID